MDHFTMYQVVDPVADLQTSFVFGHPPWGGSWVSICDGLGARPTFARILHGRNLLARTRLQTKDNPLPLNVRVITNNARTRLLFPVCWARVSRIQADADSKSLFTFAHRGCTE